MPKKHKLSALSKAPLDRILFIRRLTRNLLLAFLIIFGSLYIGMAGYHYFEGMPWIDAYENAAMILSGMGPVTELHTIEGKLFAGTYALFSGIIFLIVMAIMLAPAFLRFMHKLHLETKNKF